MKKKVWAVEREVLEMVNESAREVYPREFVATLRAEKGVITEVMLLPGTIQGSRSGTLMLHMMPIDLSVVGTAHSHPSHSNRPSRADINLFGRYGNTHIITCLPYDTSSWRAYDYNGREKELEVI